MKLFAINGPVSVVLLGLTLAVSSYVGYQTFQRQVYLSSPITGVFQADVIVPDFTFGEDPVIQYDRVILQDFTGAFRVEIKNADTGVTVCAGSGTNISYEKGEPLRIPVMLSWYVGTSCNLAPGQYFMETNYTISVEGLPNRYYSHKSNVFEVKSK